MSVDVEDAAEAIDRFRKLEILTERIRSGKRLSFDFIYVNLKARPMHFLQTRTLKLCFAVFMLVVISSGMSTFTFAQETDDPETEAIALFNKGQDAHETGDLKTAIDLYEKALKLIPDFPEAELQRGNAYQSLGDLDKAETAFRHAVSLRADWSLAQANLGALLVRRNKIDDARPFLKRAVEIDAENTPAYVALSTLAIKTNAPEAELKELYKKIEYLAAASKTGGPVWSSKALLENALKQKAAAAVSAKKALEIDPKNVTMLSLLASISLDTADAQQAAMQIAKIEALEPTAPELPSLKVRLLLSDGKNDEALKLIEAIKDPSKEILDIKAKILAATSVDSAALEKQLEAEPRNIAILGRLCSVLRVSEPLRAMEFCRRASEAEPNNVNHAIGYGAAMLKAKLYGEAAALFQKLMVAAPDNFTLRANLATALFELKRYNEAKVQFQWLVEKQPENVVAYFFLAVSYDQLAEYADAMANYQIFLRKADPKTNQLEIDKINLRLPVLQRQLDAGKGRKNGKAKG
jgi:tetratricopeptide (TPR) repeat protein